MKKIKFTLCKICYNRVDYNLWIILKCNHEICLDCFLNILTRLECPYCRRDIELKKLFTKKYNS